MLDSSFESQFNSIFGVPSHRVKPNIGACSDNWDDEDYLTDAELAETQTRYDSESDEDYLDDEEEAELNFED